MEPEIWVRSNQQPSQLDLETQDNCSAISKLRNPNVKILQGNEATTGQNPLSRSRKSAILVPMDYLDVRHDVAVPFVCRRTFQE